MSVVVVVVVVCVCVWGGVIIQHDKAYDEEPNRYPVSSGI